MNETLLPDRKKSQKRKYQYQHFVESLVMSLVCFSFIVTWLAGIVLAKGFFSVGAAMTVPFYAQYLVIQKIMQVMGWI